MEESGDEDQEQTQAQSHTPPTAQHVPVTPVHVRTRSAGEAIAAAAAASAASPAPRSKVPRYNSQLLNSSVGGGPPSPFASDIFGRFSASQELPSVKAASRWHSKKIQSLHPAKQPSPLDQCGEEDPDVPAESPPPPPRAAKRDSSNPHLSTSQLKPPPPPLLTCSLLQVPQPFTFCDYRSDETVTFGIPPLGRGILYRFGKRAPLLVKEMQFDGCGNRLVMPGIKKAVTIRPNDVHATLKALSRLATAAGIGHDLGMHCQVHADSSLCDDGELGVTERLRRCVLRMAAPATVNYGSFNSRHSLGQPAATHHPSIQDPASRISVVCFNRVQGPGGKELHLLNRTALIPKLGLAVHGWSGDTANLNGSGLINGQAALKNGKPQGNPKGSHPDAIPSGPRKGKKGKKGKKTSKAPRKNGSDIDPFTDDGGDGDTDSNYGDPASPPHDPYGNDAEGAASTDDDDDKCRCCSIA